MYGSPIKRRQSYKRLISSLGRALSILIISLPQINVAAAPDDEKTETASATESTKNTQKLLNLSLKLDRLKDTANAFDPSMGEVYLELAEHYFQQEKFEAATDAFSKALHLTRINNGLYHGKQLQISDRLVASLTADRKWGDAFKQQQFNHWLGNRYFADNPKKHRAQLQRLAEWHMKVFISSGKELSQHNTEAKKIYQQYIAALEDHESNSVSEITPVLKGLVAANFYHAQTLQEQIRRDISLPREEQSLKEAQAAQQKRFSFSTGKEIFSRVLSIYNLELQAEMSSNTEGKSKTNDTSQLKARAETQAETEQPVIAIADTQLSPSPEPSNGGSQQLREGRILTLIELGDWNLLFLKYSTAAKLYRQAYNEADPALRLKGSLFKTPIEIPVLPPALLMAKGNSVKHVILNFDVSDRGKIYNINVAKHSPKNSRKYHSIAIRRAKKLRFRPTMDADGRLTRSTGLEQVFSFP